MRYLVIKVLETEQKSKLARFAFAVDAVNWATKLATEHDAQHTEVLDTQLKKTYFDSRVGHI